MSLRCGNSVLDCCGALLWWLCCESGTEGCAFLVVSMTVFLSCWSRCFGACLGALLGGCLGLCPNLACDFCFVTGSSVWCHGGFRRSVPPVSNVLPYLILLILKQQQIPHKCRLVKGTSIPNFVLSILRRHTIHLLNYCSFSALQPKYDQRDKDMIEKLPN